MKPWPKMTLADLRWELSDFGLEERLAPSPHSKKVRIQFWLGVNGKLQVVHGRECASGTQIISPAGETWCIVLSPPGARDKLQHPMMQKAAQQNWCVENSHFRKHNSDKLSSGDPRYTCCYLPDVMFGCLSCATLVCRRANKSSWQSAG